MNVVPLVAQEIASRYHKHVSDRLMGSAVTTDLAAQLTRLWLLKERDRLDDAGDVRATVPHIEALTNDMLNFLLHRCSEPTLATLSLQVRFDTLRSSHVEQQRKADVQHEGIRVQLEGALTALEPGLATPEQLWGTLAVCFLHHYGDPNAEHPTASSVTSSGPAYSETLAAVSAALPRSQVPTFLRLDRVEQTSQLRQLRRITWGLRLYQKEIGRSAGMDILPLSTAASVPLMELEVKTRGFLAEIEPRVRLTRALLVSPTCPLDATAQQRLKEEYHHSLLVLHVVRCVQCGLQQLRTSMDTRVTQPFTTLIAELRHLLMPGRRGVTAKFDASSTTAAAAAAPAAAQPSRSPSIPVDGAGAPTVPPEPRASTTPTEGSNAAPAVPAAPAGAPTPASEAAPKKVVFPKFMEVADAYEVGVQCAAEMPHWATLLRVAMESMAAYPSTLPMAMAQEAARLADAVSRGPPLPSAAAMEAEMNALLNSETTAQRLPPGVHVRYRADLPLHTVDATVAQVYPESMCALRGYCPVQFVAGRPTAGLLLPGRVPRSASGDSGTPSSKTKGSLGCVEVSGRVSTAALPRPLYFIFADAAAMRAFGADPWRYVDGCLNAFHATDPSLSLVMGRAEELPRELYLEGARVVERMTSSGAFTRDSQERRHDHGTQTGQIDAHIDHNYYWNEWDLRRHALKLANLLNMHTHASQTGASHLRREATTQADPPKNAETQTLHDAATQPPHVVQYIKGLRGSETSAVEQVRKVIQY